MVQIYFLTFTVKLVNTPLSCNTVHPPIPPAMSMHGNDHRTAAIDTIDQGYNNRSSLVRTATGGAAPPLRGTMKAASPSAAHVGQPACCLAMNESIGRIISNIVIIIIFFLGNRCIGRKERRGKSFLSIFLWVTSELPYNHQGNGYTFEIFE